MAAKEKAIKDLTKDELVALCEKQKAELKAANEKEKNLVNYVNGEFGKLRSSFQSIVSTCQLSIEHIGKIGK